LTQRVERSIESLGGASNLLLLAGVGASLLVSYLSGAIIGGGPTLASDARLRQAAPAFADTLTSRSDFT